MTSYHGPMVDTDLHHLIKRNVDIISYLPQRWRDYVEATPANARGFGIPSGGSSSLLESGMLHDSYPEDGTFPGSDYPLMKVQLLDKYPIYRALLTHNTGAYGSHLNPYFASALCSAVNDCNADQWLSLDDDRLYSVICIPWGLPEDAIAEIKRMSKQPRMTGVLLVGNPIGRPIGDPFFHPILKAIAEAGLVLVTHVANSDRPNHQFRSIGEKIGTVDVWPHSGQSALHYVSSLIVHGVFEKYQDFRILFNEYGVGQIPAFVWRLEAMYDLLKFESPWVRRRPFEYMHDRVRFSTQPLEESRDDKGAIGDLLESLDGAEDILCFSSDYPHISFDDPMSVQRLLPARWYRKVFCDNACDFFGWPRPAVPAERSAVAS